MGWHIGLKVDIPETSQRDEKMIEAQGITKRLGNFNALKGVDVFIERGTINVVVGPSGSGKSTLMRALILVDPPDEGSITIDNQRYSFPGKIPSGNSNLWPRLTAVFQQVFLWPHLTLEKNVLLPLKGRRGSDGEEESDTLFKFFDLDSVRNKYPNEASVGERQRAAIIRALVLQPQYLFVDEITSALDIEQSMKVLKILQERREQGTGILAITHYLGFARRAADHVIFLDRGIIEAEGDRSILSDPQSSRLKRFIEIVE